MKFTPTIFLFFFGIILVTGFSSCKNHSISQKSDVPIFEGLDSHHMDITTPSGLAEIYFNQGLHLCYGFNYPEASRSFRESIRLDSTCAMCYWGLAYSLGPNYNAPMEEKNRKEAYWAIQKAVSYKSHCYPWKQAIIEATSHRYSDEEIPNREKLNQAYSQDLQRAHLKFKSNADLEALYAESLMLLHPWDLWEKDGSSRPWTPEIVSTLRSLLSKYPRHPSANHLYIHAIEASRSPEDALPSAKLLETLMPGSGHLVHMPSHIYIRIGDYHQATLVNQKAIIVDSLYVAKLKIASLYPLTYYPHNIHFLAASAGLEGRGELSANAAFRLADKMNPDSIIGPDMGTMQHFYSIPYFILVKFGQWDRILELKMPNPELVYPTAILHYARGMAFAGKKEREKALEELALLDTIAHDTVIDPLTIWGINTGRQVIEIARNVLDAEINLLTGEHEKATALYKIAIRKEDSLLYNEPSDWFFSVRHHYGNLLLDLEQYKEAEKVYRKDLVHYPKNGYALNGLYLALSEQDKKEDADKVKIQFEEAFKYADVRLEGSRVKALVVKQFRLERNLATSGGEYQKFVYCGR